jgi:hypothetical protein
VAAALCLLTATACDETSPTIVSALVDQRFTLAQGEVAIVAGTGVRLQFVTVTGDSRCPADAVCILGGDAIVHVRVFEGDSPRDYELHTGDSRRATVVHGAFRIGLVELQPYPFSSRAIRSDEYRATLVVTRA